MSDEPSLGSEAIAESHYEDAVRDAKEEEILKHHTLKEGLNPMPETSPESYGYKDTDHSLSDASFEHAKKQGLIETKPMNLYQRIRAVMQDVEAVEMTKSEHLRWTYMSHDSVTRMLSPLLVKHGIVCLPHVKNIKTSDIEVWERDQRVPASRVELQLDVKLANADDKDDFEIITGFAYGIDKSDKGPGKAISYAFKYALEKVFFLVSGLDTDQDDFTEVKETKPSNVSKKPPIEVKRVNPISVPPVEYVGEWRDRVIHFGKNKGMTLGHLADVNPRSLRWYCFTWEFKEYKGRYSDNDIELAKAVVECVDEVFPGEKEPSAARKALSNAGIELKATPVGAERVEDVSTVVAGVDEEEDEIPF